MNININEIYEIHYNNLCKGTLFFCTFTHNTTHTIWFNLGGIVKRASVRTFHVIFPKSDAFYS